jgi:hypothetical protein
MLTVMTMKRALTVSVTMRTIVPAAAETATDRAIAKLIPSNPVRVGGAVTVKYEMAATSSVTVAAYASSHLHDGISNGSA